MDLYQAINTRHTIRDFSPREVDPALIKNIIGAGVKAPSNNHLRQWHFVILNDPARRKAILDQVIKPLNRSQTNNLLDQWQMTDPIQRAMYLDGVPKQYSMLFNAGALILPFFHQPSPLLKPKSLSDLNGFASIWCVVENMLLAAAAEGIYGVVRIPFDAETKVIHPTLNIPEGYFMPCWMALGYPAEDAVKPKQVDFSLDEHMHYDTW